MKPPNQRTILLAAYGERGARRARGVREMDREPPESSVSRREMLKRLGVTTGVAWAAPVLSSIQTPAHASQAYPPPPGGCPNAVLAGGPNATDPVCVDDDLEVRLNGSTVFVDDDEFATCNPPISLGSVDNGDQLRVIASDSSIFGGNRFLSPLHLHCPSTGAQQTLDADGHPAECCFAPQPGGVVFYDQTFTVSL